MNCNTAVFYDVENLISLFNNKSHKTLQLDEIHKRILGLDVVQGISVQRAYADWALQINRNLRSYVLQIGIEPVQIFNTNHNDKVKNAADVSLIIDAVECLSRHPGIENYVIASGDGIFAFLAKKLHEYGKRVIGCGFDRNTNMIFRNSCDVFISLEKSDHSLNIVVKNINKGTIIIHAEEDERERPVYMPPKSVPPSPANIPNSLPKIRYSEILLQSNVPILKKAEDIPSELHLIKRMLNLIFDEGNPTVNLEISLFRTYVDHFLPSFKLAKYKCKKFVDFMKLVVTNSPYCLMVTDATVIRISLRGTEEEKSTQVEDIPDLFFTLQDGTNVNSLFDIEDGVPFTFSLGKPNELSKPLEVEMAEIGKSENIAEPILEMDELEAQNEPEKTDEIDESEELKGLEKAEIVIEPTVKTTELSNNDENPPEKNSIRKWIKDSFIRLSQDNKLSAAEVKLLLTREYAQETFTLRTPIFKKFNSREDPHEQRLVDGKVRYWKEEFIFRGKPYLVFKEWAEKQHRARFEAWLEKIDS